MNINRDIEERWDQIADELDSLFPGQGSRLLGTDAPQERNNIDIDGEEVLEAIDEVLDALSSLGAFEDALENGVFQDARIDEDDVVEVFIASQTIERLGFGWSANTRFGAYSKRERTDVDRSLSFLAGEEGLGAFAYSPLGPARTADVPGRGEALYVGETIAAGGGTDQEIYRGDFELGVRLSTREVSGRVSNLVDRFGDPWELDFSDAVEIFLPTATLHTTLGSFQSSSGARASITYTSIALSPRPRILTAALNGQLVGERGSADAAIGTWELTRGSSTILTGAFGAEYETLVESDLPPERTDEGEEAETSLIAQPDRNGDIEIAARDADGDRIELPASELYRDGGVVISGERLFEIAGAAVEDQIEVLGVFRRVDDTSTRVRNEIWDDVNQALEDHVFGPSDPNSLGSSYPSRGSLDDRDEDAIDILEDVLTALSSPGRFEDSLGDDGVFEDVLGSESNLDRYDFNAIFDALSYRVEVHFGSTDYGRFGAWAKAARDYAVSDSLLSLSSSEVSDVFAYSPLGQTTYSAGDPNFPRNFTASYRGQTRAVDRQSNGPRFYDGDVFLTVEWSNVGSGSAVHAVIRDLFEISDGSSWVHRGFDVEEIVLSGVRTRLDSDRRVYFDSSPSIRIRYYDIGRPESGFSGGSTSHEGRFVGYSGAGPLGVIGVWALGDLKGAYSADLAH